MPKAAYIPTLRIPPFLQKPIIERAVFLFFSCLCVLYILIAGLGRLGLEDTDSYSEKYALVQARSVLEGRHVVGIPLDEPDTHYPQGPSYLIALMMRVGISDTSKLRILPFSIAILVLLISVSVVSVSPASRSVKCMMIASILLVYNSRGVLNWMGALHEHSYAMSISFFLLLISTYVSKNIEVVLFIFGVIAGWIGFDFLLLNILATFTTRTLFYLQNRTIKKADALWSAFHDAGWLASGIAWAVLSHLIQNSIYFGSFNHAIKDLIGAAGGRMNIPDVANRLNPVYYHSLQGYAQHIAWVDKNSSLSIFFTLIKVFIWGRWIDKKDKILLLIVCIGWIALMVKNWSRVEENGAVGGGARNRFHFNVLLFLVLAIFTSASWSLIMPWHTLFHYHFLPRHFFVIILTVFFSLHLFEKPNRAYFFNYRHRSNALQTFVQIIPFAVIVCGFIRVLLWTS